MGKSLQRSAAFKGPKLFSKKTFGGNRSSEISLLQQARIYINGPLEIKMAIGLCGTRIEWVMSGFTIQEPPM